MKSDEEILHRNELRSSVPVPGQKIESGLSMHRARNNTGKYFSPWPLRVRDTRTTLFGLTAARCTTNRSAKYTRNHTEIRRCTK